MRNFSVQTQDDHCITLLRTGPAQGPVVAVTHGTFSSTASCKRLCDFLAAQGFGVWSFNWRGHGNNPETSPHYDLETVASMDIDSALQEIHHQEKGRKIALIGHSGGGIASAIWAARKPEAAREYLSGMVLLAAQVTHAAARMARAGVFGYRIWLALRDWAPASHMVGPEAESARLMRQWCQWNLQRSFTGHDGMDYFQALSAVSIPILALAGAGDRRIAPWQGCEALAKAFGGTDVQFLLCGKAAGFREDYSHSRLLMAGNAQADVYPQIAQWITARSCAQRNSA